MKENNKLIAEFMGVDQVDIDTWLETNSNLQYHNSWDWLMPVLKKINLEISPNTRGLWRMIINPTEYDIENVHAQAVYFIKEYNEKN